MRRYGLALPALFVCFLLLPQALWAARADAGLGMFWSIFWVFMGGMALNLTPCVYPLIPITISYFSAKSTDPKEGRGSTCINALLYILGIALMNSYAGGVRRAFRASHGNTAGKSRNSCPGRPGYVPVRSQHVRLLGDQAARIANECSSSKLCRLLRKPFHGVDSGHSRCSVHRAVRGRNPRHGCKYKGPCFRFLDFFLPESWGWGFRFLYWPCFRAG